MTQEISLTSPKINKRNYSYSNYYREEKAKLLELVNRVKDLEYKLY